MQAHCRNFRNLRSLALLWQKPGNPIHSTTLSTGTAAITEENTTKKFEFIEMQGRPWVLLGQPSDVSLALCVSADLDMSRGVARDFKRKFGGKENLKKQMKQVGQVAVKNRNESSFVYYLITRKNWWDPSTPHSIQLSLEALRDHCLDNGVKKLAIPRLGTGYDQVDWPCVKDILKQVFNNCGISITAYSTR